MPIRGIGRPNYSGSVRDLSYEGPSFGYTSNSSTFGLEVRDNGVSQANLNTTPSISTYIRDTNTREPSRNISTDIDGNRVRIMVLHAAIGIMVVSWGLKTQQKG